MVTVGDAAEERGIRVGVARYLTDGSLDPSFGSGGEVLTPIGKSVRVGAVALQPDGKLIVAARAVMADGTRFAVVRYRADGGLDESFGVGGVVLTAVGSTAWDVAAVVVQPDGRLVVAGEADNKFALVRYLASGALDSSFGAGGKVLTDLGTQNVELSALALQTDGKLIAAGAVEGDFALMRYTASGGADPAFGSGGRVATAIGSYAAIGAVAVGSDGTIIAAGEADGLGGSTGRDIVVARYLSTGALDAAFGSLGTTSATLDYLSFASDLAIGPAGTITVVGSTGDGSHRDFAVVRFTSAGALDGGFSGDGKLIEPIDGARWSQAGALALLSGGGMLVSGTAHGGSERTFATLQLTGAGGVAPAFGDGGWVRTGLGQTTQSNAVDVVAQEDGKVVTAVAVRDSNEVPYGTDAALIRYDPDGSIDADFGADGSVVEPGVEASAVATQADGTVLLAGTVRDGPRELALFRYLPNGSRDVSFGAAGEARSDISPAGLLVNAMLVQPDRKVVLVGQVGWTIAVIRYAASGELDAGFGDGGVAELRLGDQGEGNDVAIQPDGALVVAGVVDGDAAVIRLTPGGELDPTFGSGGFALTGGTRADAVALQPDAKIVVGGTANGNEFAASRFRPDGSLDAAFGTGGVSEYDVGGYLEGVALVVDAKGRLTLSGASEDGTHEVYAGALHAVRLTTSGAPDQAFGSEGHARLEVTGGKGASLGGMVATSGGRLVLAGSEFVGTYFDGWSSQRAVLAAVEGRYPLETTLTAGPSGTTSARTANFEFASPREEASFECRLDGGAWTQCSSPHGYEGLADGGHHFTVRAVDPPRVDATPAERIWTVAIVPSTDGATPDTDAPPAPDADEEAPNAQPDADTQPRPSDSDQASLDGGGGGAMDDLPDACVGSRSGVATLRDSAAATVAFTPRSTGVSALRALRRPALLERRVRGIETRTYQLRVTLVGMSVDRNGATALVVASRRRRQHTMVARIPPTRCRIGGSDAVRSKVAAARKAFRRTCGRPRVHFRRLRGRATIRGVGFFGRRDSGRGAAPNGIELQPLIGFRGRCLSTRRSQRAR